MTHQMELAKLISIHALVKRATPLLYPVLRSCLYFNPRPREEGDGSLSPFFEGGVDFNPRPREEGD